MKRDREAERAAPFKLFTPTPSSCVGNCCFQLLLPACAVPVPSERCLFVGRENLQKPRLFLSSLKKKKRFRLNRPTLLLPRSLGRQHCVRNTQIRLDTVEREDCYLAHAHWKDKTGQCIFILIFFCWWPGSFQDRWCVCYRTYDSTQDSG